MMNSCFKTISNPEADDPNIVKVVTDSDNIALYFSRAKVPYPRDHHFNAYKGHLGIYGFRVCKQKHFLSLQLYFRFRRGTHYWKTTLQFERRNHS